MASNKLVGEGKEFPTDWHLERYVADLQRELDGAVGRGDEAYADTVRKELSRFSKEPAKAAKK